MKWWYITTIILVIIYVTLGVLTVGKNELISTLLTFGAATSALIGIVLYNKQMFTGTMVFLILAGLLGFPLGIIFIVAGISIKVLAKKSVKTLQVVNNDSNVIPLDRGGEHFSSKSFTVFMASIGTLLNLGFWIVVTIYHGWTLIIAFKAGLVPFFLTLFLPVLSNIYWFIKMIDNSAYFWLAISTIIIKIVATIISSNYEE